MATDAPAPILELADVVSGYGAMTILNGTTFRVRRGTITTIIGPNGAGKSTVFKTVFGLLTGARRPHHVRRRRTRPTPPRAACSRAA